MINYLVTKGSITLHYNGQTRVVAKDDPRFEQVLQAIRIDQLDTIPGIVDTEAALRAQGLNAVDGLVHVAGEAMPPELNDRIMEYQAQQLPFSSLLRFWDNLKLNPSFNSRKQLFKFLENKGHSLTEDGCFIGYRGVTEDFKDKHSKSFNNAPGQVCEIPRSAVDDNPENTCSFGLHVGGYEYAKDFASGGKLVLVKVNPKDVVAVPNDYNGQKMRVCRFEVLKEATDIIPHTVVSSTGDEYDYSEEEDWTPEESFDDSEEYESMDAVSNADLSDALRYQTAQLPAMVGLAKQIEQAMFQPKKVDKKRYANNHAKRDKTGKFAPKKKAKKRAKKSSRKASKR